MAKIYFNDGREIFILDDIMRSSNFSHKANEKDYIEKVIYDNGHEEHLKYISYEECLKYRKISYKAYIENGWNYYYHCAEGPAFLGKRKVFYLYGQQLSPYDFFKDTNFGIEDLIIYTLDNEEHIRNAACLRIKEIESTKNIQTKKETRLKNIFKKIFTNFIKTFL